LEVTIIEKASEDEEETEDDEEDHDWDTKYTHDSMICKA